MIVKLYIRHGDNPDSIANQAKTIIEQETGQPCNVNISGRGMEITKSNPYIDNVAALTYRD